jgi:hypothetical protein
MILKVLKDSDRWIRILCSELTSRGKPERRGYVVKLLEYAHLEIHTTSVTLTKSGFTFHPKTLILWVRGREWERMPHFTAVDVKESVQGLASILGCGGSKISLYAPDEEPFTPRVKIEEDDTDEVIGLNNCFFKTETTIEHDELRFRSPAEVAIYDELKKRHLLFFPNAAAVLGGEGKKREPDFLICHKGKWGILEVMGKSYHNETTAVKDHERARLFKNHGIKCIEFYSGARCVNSPSAVVDEFLSLLGG